MIDTLTHILWETWSLIGEMSPYLLFGFAMAGILSVCVSPEFVERHLGGRGFGPVWKAAIFGVPLPLCSCGVIPVAASFRRHGASRAAVASFLLSTPQTGIDSILVTYGMLGLGFAVYRPVVALVTGLFGGLLVMLFAQNGDGDVATEACHEACCSPDAEKHNLVRRAAEYAFVTLPRDIGVPLLVGAVIAGVIGAVAPADQWRPYLGNGFWSIVMMMLIGIPLYVCATASVPIAVGLMHLGASPGAALAFLIAGPASNAATLTTIWKLLGPRSVLLYLATIALSATGGGVLLDWFSPAVPVVGSATSAHCHDMAGGWGTSLWAVVLLSLVAFSYFANWRRQRTLQKELDNVEQSENGSDSNMERIELTVGGMSCSHCAAAVTKALQNCPGVKSAVVDLAGGRAVVVGTQLTPERLVAAVVELGYSAKIAAVPSSAEK